MRIYADIVLLLNISINSMLLLFTAWGSKTAYRGWRLVLSAILGSIYSLGEVIIPFDFFYALPVKIMFSIFFVYVCFGSQPVRKFLLVLAVFYAVSFFFGGAVLGWIFFMQTSGWIKNYAVVIQDVTWRQVAGGLVMGMVLIFFVIRRILENLSLNKHIYKVTITYAGQSVKISAILDTGNRLCTMLDRKPVMLVSYKALEVILDPMVQKFFQETPSEFWVSELTNCDHQEWLQRTQIISCRSVGGNRLLVGFRPDSIRIYMEDGEVENKNVYIGIYSEALSADHSFDGLLHTEMFLKNNISYKNKEAGICA
ncbi:hypothetical protein P22_0106 [Propionispora sp. 2/2-37]|uniref:sigma-E processing peptidase SpoIIGA n=1 Tax=Propionispora sp. 2/2-37 TaxID=1677858 RepID=UPI0006BB87D3|nr:sigma-E processing peptidase SpoIIGA [Propionispora sp. 2/2-37]CUH94044.1 hypothetical protein P22_0106 [Propionispora sp. 2/2-37]